MWRGRRLLALYHPGRLGRVTRPEVAQREDISVLREILVSPDERPSSIPNLTGVHPDGARLVLRAEDGTVFGNLAFKMGVQVGRKPVFAFQVPRLKGPPFWNNERVFVEGLVQRGGKTVIACRQERGICEIEVHPLTDDERAALRAWTESLPEGVLEAMAESMNAMLDPSAL